jgi:hypothetical protein
MRAWLPDGIPPRSVDLLNELEEWVKDSLCELHHTDTHEKMVNLLCIKDFIRKVKFTNRQENS